MIVSHHQAFVFVAVPKVASQSIRKFLRAYTVEGDWEQCGLYERRLFPIPHLSLKGTGHLGLQDLRPFLNQHQWQNYFKFGFVREPMDRFLSACFYMIPKLHQQSNPNSTILEYLKQPEWLNQFPLRPQSDFLCINGEISADFIGRYESLEEDMLSLMDKINLAYINPETTLKISKLNVTKKRNRSFIPNTKIVELVQEIYARDYHLFNYSQSSIEAIADND